MITETTLKSIGAKLLLFAPTPFLTMIDTMKYSIVALLLLIVLDLGTALTRYFFDRWKKKGTPLAFFDFRYGIQSDGLRKTLIKYVVYSTICIITFILEMFVLGRPLQIEVPIMNRNATLTELAIWVCAMIEIKSIDENIEGLTGKGFIETIVDILKHFKKVYIEIKNIFKKE